MAGAGLTVRRMTIARQKARYTDVHIMTVNKFISENVRLYMSIVSTLRIINKPISVFI